MVLLRPRFLLVNDPAANEETLKISLKLGISRNIVDKFAWQVGKTFFALELEEMSAEIWAGASSALPKVEQHCWRCCLLDETLS